MMRATGTAIAGALCALALAGCAGGSGGLVNMWRDPAYRGAAFSNLYVIALKPNPARRRLVEDAFVERLAKSGVRAVASYTDFADAPPDTNQILEAVRAAGYDGVVIASTLPEGASQTFVPGYITREAQTHYDRWTGQYYTVWVDVTHPGYTESETVARNQIDLWSTRDRGRLVWSGVSERLDPNDYNALSRSIAKHAIPEWIDQGLVPPKL